jgi:hypothetical protein
LAELVVEFDVLVRTPIHSLELPVALLHEPGPVIDPGLAIAGVAIEVITADDVQGPWTWDYSSFPESIRPHPGRPEIGLALRVNGPIGRMTLLDSSGERIGVNPGSIGPHADGSRTEFWEDHPSVRSSSTMRLEVVGEVEPLGPPPSV